MTMPSIREPELDEDEWDPQGLNAMSFDVVEAEEDDEDEDGLEDEEDVEATLEEIDEEDEEEGEGIKDPDVDGLAELEQMEQSLLREESLDFAMINNEEE